MTLELSGLTTRMPGTRELYLEAGDRLEPRRVSLRLEHGDFDLVSW